MRIVIISSSLYPASEDAYGSEHISALLADELGKSGHDVILFATPQSTEGHYKLLLMPCTHGMIDYDAESFPYDEYPELLEDADYIIDKSATKINIEHLWFFGDRRKVEGKVACYSSGGWANPREPVRSALHHVAVSRIHREHGIRSGLKPEQVSVIPYGINTEFYKPDLAKRSDYCLYLGAARIEKGIMSILDIAERMPEQRFILAWRVMSEVHRKADREFKAELKRRNLPNVEFHELPEEDQARAKVELYQRAKCFLQPSSKKYTEYLGLTTLEALACGTPVVRESWGSAPEIFEHGKHGFLCEDMEGYIDSIRKVDKLDPHECRKLIKRRFAKERYAADYLALFEEMRA